MPQIYLRLFPAFPSNDTAWVDDINKDHLTESSAHLLTLEGPALSGASCHTNSIWKDRGKYILVNTLLWNQVWRTFTDEVYPLNALQLNLIKIEEENYRNKKHAKDEKEKEKIISTYIPNKNSVTFLHTKSDERLIHTTCLQNMLKPFRRIYVSAKGTNSLISNSILNENHYLELYISWLMCIVDSRYSMGTGTFACQHRSTYLNH